MVHKSKMSFSMVNYCLRKEFYIAREQLYQLYCIHASFDVCHNDGHRKRLDQNGHVKTLEQIKSD